MSWIEDRITDYYKWVRERVKVRTDETTGWSVISTPFLGAYNDPIEIFIRTNGENIELSDDGVIFDNLRQLGVNVNRSLKRKEWVEYILRNYGVTIEDNELRATATLENFPQKKHSLLCAMLEISEMEVLAQNNVATIFKEDVKSFYDKNGDKEDLKIIARTFKTVTDKNERIAFLRAGIINKLITACAEVFIRHYDAIMAGTFNRALIKHAEGTCKTAYDACTKLAYERIYHTNMVTQIQIAGFKILGTILKEYTDAILKPETYYARNILSVMPEQYKVSKEDSMYTKIQTVVDYVSGMTDSYALNLYRKIKGIELPEIR